jgi:urease alpha subunit
MGNPLMDLVAGICKHVCAMLSNIYCCCRFPEQRISRQEALRGKNNIHICTVKNIYLVHGLYPGMTIDPAYASFTETILGSLEVGKHADYVLLSQDIMAIPEDMILATQVLATAMDGKLVYGDI